MLKYATGLKVPRRYWDNKGYRVKSGVSFPEPDAEAINDKLRLISTTVVGMVKADPDVPVDELKDELDFELGYRSRPKEKRDTTLLEYVQGFIRKSSNHGRTIQKYRSTQSHLQEYEKFLGKTITFDQIKPEFSQHFESWLYNHADVDSPNTASKHIQILRQFVRDAHLNQYHTNSAYQSSKFGVKRVKTSKHFLEEEELERLALSDFSDRSRMERVRDLWLVAAYSGLRYSDFSRLQPKHFIEEDGIRMIHLETYKGRNTKDDTEVVIPVLPALEVILKKYDYLLPKAFSQQEMNRMIKKVCQQAGLNREVANVTSKKGKLVEVRLPIHQVLTNHSARYTFINIMLNEYGIPAQDLRKVTGQSLSVLMDYERGGKKKNAKKVYNKTMEAIRSRKP